MIRLANKPKKIKPQKAMISIPKDDKLLVMTQRGGKLKAHIIRRAEGAHRARLQDKTIGASYLVVESREDLMFVKEEYKFHQDRLRRLTADFAAAIRAENKSFFEVLEVSRVYRPHRVKLKWES